MQIDQQKGTIAIQTDENSCHKLVLPFKCTPLLENHMCVGYVFDVSITVKFFIQQSFQTFFFCFVNFFEKKTKDCFFFAMRSIVFIKQTERLV